MDELEDPNAAVGTAEVTADAAGVPVVKLGGEIDMSNVDELRGVIEPLIEDPRSVVVFDLGALEFMDSSGIALLLEVAAVTETVEVREPSVIVRRIIEATGLSDVLQIVK